MENVGNGFRMATEIREQLAVGIPRNQTDMADKERFSAAILRPQIIGEIRSCEPRLSTSAKVH